MDGDKLAIVLAYLVGAQRSKELVQLNEMNTQVIIRHRARLTEILATIGTNE